MLDIGGALKLLGGNPLMKVKKVIGEYLPLTKSLDGGPLGDMLGGVLRNGLGSVFQNPLGAVMGGLQGQLGDMVGNLEAALGDGLGGLLGGADGLVSALTGAGGLGDALGRLSNVTDLLSGVAMPGLGEFGLLDAIGHDGIAGMLGDALPAGLGLDAVLGPLNLGGAIEAMAGDLPAMVSDVIAGAIPIPAAIAQVAAHTVAITDTIAASHHALSTVTALAPTLATVSSTAAALVSAPPAIQSTLEMIVRPKALASMRKAVATHLDED